MRNMLIASFGLLALGAASLAQANPGSRLTVVQTKYDRLAAYFDAKCDADDLTPKCRRVEAGMMKLGKQIEKLNGLPHRVRRPRGRREHRLGRGGSVLLRLEPVLPARRAA